VGDITATQFHEIQASKRLAVAWGFFWRGLVASLCSVVGGGLAGGIIGFLVGISNSIFHIGASREAVMHFSQILGGVAGLIFGLAVFWFYVAWLFRARFGGYRLRLAADVPGI
jgi:hypothetical protein